MEGERYNLEKAQEEAEKMLEKIETGKAKTYQEAEKTVEAENRTQEKKFEEDLESWLTPEIVEKVMKKTLDPETDGTAYHILDDRENGGIDKIFREGLSGIMKGRNITGINISDASVYKDLVKKNSTSLIYFNIIGRSFSEQQVSKLHNHNVEIEGLHAAERNWQHWQYSMRWHRWKDHGSPEVFPDFKPNPVLLFKLEGFKESEDIKEFSKKTGLPSRTFGVTHDGKEKMIDGMTFNDDLSGFFTHARISSRNFRSLIIGDNSDLNPYWSKEKYIEYIMKKYYPSQTVEEVHENQISKFLGDFDPNNIKAKHLSVALEIVKSLKETPERLVPIYDSYGNMVWPKQMRYEDVQNFFKELNVPPDNEQLKIETWKTRQKEREEKEKAKATEKERQKEVQKREYAVEMA